MGGYLVKQVASPAIFHDQIHMFRGFICLIVLTNVGMIKLGQNFDFLFEFGEVVPNLLFLHGFYSDPKITVDVVVS